MLGQDSLRAAVRDAGIDVEPVFLAETGSTNDDLGRLAERGAAEWTVVAAGHQVAGRGRLGRSWASVPGGALQLSVLLRPRMPAERAPLLSLLAAEAMAAACHRVAGADVRSKWPNDLLVDGRKVGGVLPEARVAGGELEHVILGVGVNLTLRDDDFPEEIRGVAGSIAPGGEVDQARLLEAFLTGFRDEYRPEEPDFAVRVVTAYVAACATIGLRVRAITTAGVAVEGTAVGLDHLGGLVVETAPGHEHVVAFGEVAHLNDRA